MSRAAGLLLAITIALPCAAAPALRVIHGSNGAVGLYWTLQPGATAYDVERTSSYPAWTFQVRTGADNWAQSGLAANSVYIYRVVPRDAANNAMAPSNAAIVSTYTHGTNPLPEQELVKLQHILDLRTVITAIRQAAGAGTPTWTRPTLTTQSLIAKDDLQDLRSSFDAALTNVGAPLPAYIDPSLDGQTFKRMHVQQLRDLARAYPERVFASGSNVTNAYFSPNGDGAKDTATFTAAVALYTPPRTDFRWRVDVRHPVNGVVRSGYGSGTAIGYVWDGRSSAGTVQPEGSYTFELVDLDSLDLPLTTAAVVLDLTQPNASITSPADGFLVSNVLTGGTGDVSVTGTATDDVLLDQWQLDRLYGAEVHGIKSAATPVTSALLATWQTLPASGPLPNGNTTLRLTVTDKAGNRRIATVPVTIGHFTMTRSKSQMNAGAGETVTYTSVVPFTLQQKIEVRRGGSVVRTLFNGSRAAGSYDDTWDGKDASGNLVADALYQYVGTATQGASSVTWDRSNVLPELGSSQYEYPRCWTGSAWLPCDSTTATFPFDSYAGVPLKIAYCVGQGNPETGCSGTLPALVVLKMTNASETSELCDTGCIVQEYQPSGRREVQFYGLGTSGNYVAGMTRMTAVRRYGSIPENATLLYGTAPVVATAGLQPRLFSPGSVPAPVGGQAINLNVTRFAGRPITASASIRNLDSPTALRTIATPSAVASDTVSLTWDGRADNGLPAAAGLYEVFVTVTDSNGSSASVRLISIVRY